MAGQALGYHRFWRLPPLWHEWRSEVHITMATGTVEGDTIAVATQPLIDHFQSRTIRGQEAAGIVMIGEHGLATPHITVAFLTDAVAQL